jgi:3-oxoacyl-[acyl-carrier protein] reductase
MASSDRLPLAVVTGATAGIGRAITTAIAGTGRYRLIVNSRSRDARAEELLASLSNCEASHIAADVSIEEDIERLAAGVRDHGLVAVLVNNAGQTLPSSLTDFSWEAWRQQFDVNFFSAVGLTARLLPQFSLEASVVNISSVRGLDACGREGVMAYSAAKAAMNSFTRTAAKALAPGIRVNAILPGFTATTYLERATPEQIAEWEHIAPLDRFIEPDEIAQFALALIDNRAITGGLFTVDGGFTLRPG